MLEHGFIVVSYYTLDTGYEREIQKRLLPSLAKLDIPHDIVGLKSLGRWNLNIYQKAHVIRDMLRKHSDVNVVWLDADAEVLRYPTLFDEIAGDFACHFRRGKGLSSGTMFFRNNGRIAELVNAWIAAIELHPQHGTITEQKVLQGLLPAHPNVEVERLPLAYSMIFDREQVPEPVIVHHQASRRLKKEVNRDEEFGARLRRLTRAPFRKMRRRG